MFSKSFIAPLFFFALTSVNAHAGVTPALGVAGTLSRNGVQRPSTDKPCGNADIAKTLDSSTAVPANTDGTFSAAAINFNGGGDGARSIKTVLVDASGTGKNFVPAKMVVNGDPNPTNNSQQQLSVQLPAGTKCTGGTSQDLCLASFTTTSGFGNCVVVSQGSGAATSAPSPSATPANPVRNGAAKGMKRTPSDQQDPAQPSESPNAGKKQGNKNKNKNNKNKNGGNAKKGGNAKNGDKAKNVANGKKATDSASGNTAARGMTPKRHWSSRSLNNNVAAM